METKNEVKCKNCEYEWKPRLKDRLPKQCPVCKRYDTTEKIKN